MAIANDGDPVRGLGFVALKAAYLEEQVDNLLLMLDQVEPYPEQEQRWTVSRKIDKAKRVVAMLAFEHQANLLEVLEMAAQLFELRNEVIHGRMYGNHDRPATLKAGRPGIPDRRIDSAELYDLANRLADSQDELVRPMIFEIPRAIQQRP